MSITATAPATLDFGAIIAATAHGDQASRIRRAGVKRQIQLEDARIGRESNMREIHYQVARTTKSDFMGFGSATHTTYEWKTEIVQIESPKDAVERAKREGRFVEGITVPVRVNWNA